MPKVSEAHLEARRQQIADAAFACFARSGFHGTTMQDICDEARLSPGAVYRYFASKEEIILTSCAECQSRDIPLITTAAEDADTRRVLESLADTFLLPLDGPEAQTTIRSTVQLWAEMVVNERIGDIFRDNAKQITKALTDVVRAAQQRGDLDANLEPAAIAQVMVAMHDGLILLKAATPQADTPAYTAAVKAMLTGRLWTSASAHGRYSGP